MSDKYGFDFEEVSVYANVVNLITQKAKSGFTHIDLGCGNAAISGVLIKQGIQYLGFDANSQAVERLRDRGLEAYQIDLNHPQKAVTEIFSRLGDRQIGSLSMIDVIEHLDNASELLIELAEESEKRGNFILVLSVPNFAHADIATKLLSGTWDYTDTGLLDRTHRVVYTEDYLKKVLQDAGWREVGVSDYRLEQTEQRLIPGPERFHATGGTEHLIRKIKRQVDDKYNVYQLVRSYERQGDAARILSDQALAVSILVTSQDDANGLFKLMASDRWREMSNGVPLKIIQGLGTNFPSDTGGFKLDVFIWDDFPEAVLASDYFLHYKASAGWTVSSFCEAVRQLGVLRPQGIVHAGTADTEADSELNWLEFAKSLTKTVMSRCFLPCNYIRHYKEQIVTNDAIKGAEQVLRIAARTNVTHLDLLPRPSVGDWQSSEVKKIVELLDPALTYQAFILNGKLPDKLLELIHVRTLLDDAQARLQRAETDLNCVFKTLSWRITLPLRIISRLLWLFFRTVSLARNPPDLLRRIRHRIVLGIIEVQHRVIERSASLHNLKAIQALSERRFDYIGQACLSDTETADLPEIDVSVVTFNSSKWVDQFFRSLSEQHYPLRKINMIVVDHGSTDATIAKLADWKRELTNSLSSFTVIEQENLGFGGGHSRAMLSGKSVYCLITNLDLEFLAESIVKVVRAALADQGQHVASWEFRQIPYEHPKYYDPVTLETNWSSHACILMSRNAYLKVGGYDERIFMYAEDVELSYRFRSYGYALKYVPAAVVRHFTYDSAGQIKPLQYAGSLLGNVYIRIRYGDFRDVIVGLIMYAFRFVGPEPFDGAHKMLRSDARKLMKNALHFVRGRGKSQAYFPLRDFDYEMVRDGAFWQIPNPGHDSCPPRVSIITRTYQGRGPLLRQTILSVFNQTYPAIELLIVEDGGETQRSLVDEMAALAPGHVTLKFIANKKLGRSAAGNTGLSNASGQFMMFLDDDDIIFADHLETLAAPLLENSALAATYALAFEVATSFNAGKSRYLEEGFQTHDIHRQEWDYSVLQNHNFIPIQAILFRRRLFEERGGFDQELDQLEDWNLWLRYGYQNQFKFIPKTTSYYRVPANPTLHADRQKQLHVAYEKAKNRALAMLES
jgi:GT2 family glycosyltransferase/2-polyprenyl-3-methyl-5-hydroxy-6-metoxy-1,4-benzoquinol methylase